MSVAGPEESYLGDPLWNTMSGWADASHYRTGLVVAPHFPNANGELAAEIALGKIDSLTGVSIVQIDNGKIAVWADYYDGLRSRRTALAGFFTEWVEY